MESKKKYSNKKIILVALGGSDTFEMNITVLKVLKCYKSYEINIVTTTANQNIDKLKKYISLHKNMRLHINSTQIAKLINISSFVIVTPSVILNEVVFMKKPFIAIEVVENQRCVSDFFIKKGFFIIRKNKINSLNLYIKKIVSSMYINKIKRKLKNI
jgi:spore coat polysaccharide biosynthesis predicted glycosyltransferase SpsG